MSAICEDGNVGHGKHTRYDTVTFAAILDKSWKFGGNNNYRIQMRYFRNGKLNLQTTRIGSSGRTKRASLMEECIMRE